MIVVRGAAAKPAEQRSTTFTGEVWAEPLVAGRRPETTIEEIKRWN